MLLQFVVWEQRLDKRREVREEHLEAVRTSREAADMAQDEVDDKDPTVDVVRAAELWPYPEADTDKQVVLLPFYFQKYDVRRGHLLVSQQCTQKD